MLTSVYTRARLGTGPDMSDSLAEMVGRYYCSSDQLKCKEDGREGGRGGKVGGKGGLSQKGKGLGEGGLQRMGERPPEGWWDS